MRDGGRSRRHGAGQGAAGFAVVRLFSAEATAGMQKQPYQREHPVKQVIDLGGVFDWNLVSFRVADHEFVADFR